MNSSLRVDAERVGEQQLGVEPRGVAPDARDRDDGGVERVAHGHAARAAPRTPLVGLRREAPALLVGLERGGELVELALEHAVEVVHGDLDAVVGDAALGEVVGADLLGAVAGADLRAAVGGELGLLLGERALVEPRAQHAHRLLAVLQLALLVLHRDDDAASACA